MELGLLASVIVAGSSIGGSLLALAWRADDMVSKEMRADFSSLLTSVDADEIKKNVNNWPIYCAALFDKIFGDDHLSWKCFFRSCIASFLAFVFCLVVLAQLSQEFSGTLRSLVLGEFDADDFILTLLIFLIVNVIPDYFSLLETRYVIKRMGQSKSLRRQMTWLLADILFTNVVFVISVVILLNVLKLSSDLTDTGGFLTGMLVEPGFWVKLLLEVYKSAFLLDSWSAGYFVFFWTTFFTSAWVWLYFLSQFITRLANPLRKSIPFLQYALPIKEHPFRAVGVVMAALACVSYWGVMVPIEVFDGT